jgi:hypothetical protein
MRKQGSSVETETPAHWNLIGRSVTPSASFVIAQQYSAITSLHCMFIFPRKNVALLKNVIILYFY